MPAAERHHIGGLVSPGAGGWRTSPRPADYFAAKALVEALGAAAGVAVAVEGGTRPYLHPGRAASVLVGNERKIGWVGELHPLVAREWDLEGAAAFEIDADALAEEVGPAPAFRDLTGYPAVRQDVAVVAPADVSSNEVRAAVRKGGGELLSSAEVFDVYEGEQAGEGNRSLALRLEFRAPDRTLTDEEVAARREAIEAAIGEIGGRLRA